jgi:hypothetical protein
MNLAVRASEGEDDLVGSEVCPDAIAIDRKSIVGLAAQETRETGAQSTPPQQESPFRGCTQPP